MPHSVGRLLKSNSTGHILARTWHPSDQHLLSVASRCIGKPLNRLGPWQQCNTGYMHLRHPLCTPACWPLSLLRIGDHDPASCSGSTACRQNLPSSRLRVPDVLPIPWVAVASQSQNRVNGITAQHAPVYRLCNGSIPICLAPASVAAFQRLYLGGVARFALLPAVPACAYWSLHVAY